LIPLDNMHCTAHEYMHSDDEYVVVEDPPELVVARQKLAQYTARKDEQEPPGLCAPNCLIDVSIPK